MRRVLFLAYFFPPIGGAGAQRPSAFVRHLPQHGYAPVVVTGPGPTESRWAPRDEALARDLPAGTTVVRVPGPEPHGGSGWHGRLEHWLGFQSPWSRWWVEGAEAAALELEETFDLVYAWMSPFETTAPAASLGRRLGIPWVADLGDPWALDEMFVYPTALHRRRARIAMHRGLSSAAAIIMSTPEAAHRVRTAFPDFSAKQILCIPNGFNRSDFAAAPHPRTDSAFRVVHTGYFHTELGLRQRRWRRLRSALGGTEQGVDFLTRSHVFLLKAVDRLLQRRPALGTRLELHFAGLLGPTDLRIAEESPVSRIHGYLAHDKTLDLVRTADALFLPMHNLQAGRRAGIVPGKTYEYLATGRPILAAVPEGDARDILLAAGRAYVCRPDDVECLADALEEAMDTREPQPRRADVVARFEYERLSAELAATFSRVCERA